MEHFPSDISFMKEAILVAKQGIDQGQSPFGAVVVKGQLVVCCHNTVWKTTDPTAHAEINAIREVCKRLGSIDLSGAMIFSTCEPCPMCMSAIHWAKISCVYYGASIDDALRAGFSELTISAKDVVRIGQSSVDIVSGVCRTECAELFNHWRTVKLGTAY